VLGLGMRVGGRLGSGGSRLPVRSGVLLPKYGPVSRSGTSDSGNVMVPHLRLPRLGLSGIRVIIRHCRRDLSLSLWVRLRDLLWINIGVHTRLQSLR
jgi:hypothetical protein